MVLALRHDHRSRDTYDVFHCRDETTLASIHTALVAMQSFAHVPHLLPFIYTSVSLDRAISFYYSVPWYDYRSILRTLGCDSYFTPGAAADSPDITSMPRTLASLSCVAANVIRDGTVTAAQIACAIEFADEILNSTAGYSTDMDAGMRDRLGIMLQQCERLKLDIESIRETIQAVT